MVKETARYVFPERCLPRYLYFSFAPLPTCVGTGARKVTKENAALRHAAPPGSGANAACYVEVRRSLISCALVF